MRKLPYRTAQNVGPGGEAADGEEYPILEGTANGQSETAKQSGRTQQVLVELPLSIAMSFCMPFNDHWS